MEEASVSKTTAIDVYQWLREICSSKLLTMTIKLGGPGKLVQIDESLFRHKLKVKTLLPYLQNVENDIRQSFHSIIEGEAQDVSCGFLAWSTVAQNQPWGTWNWYLTGLQRPLCQLSAATLSKVLLSTQISGEPTTKYNSSQCLDTPDSEPLGQLR